ncbi:MAG: DUF6427 family protein [Bacteroidales bacterium]|jgi:hypothetical protein|nr:DUF6427 family protein [Bacteroidales bacterium]
MFDFLEKNRWIQRFLLFLFFSIYCSVLIFHPGIEPPHSNAPFYQLIYQLLSPNPWMITIVGILLLLLQLVLFYFFALKNELLTSKSIIPLLLFLLLVLFSKVHNPISPVFFINLCILIVFNIHNINQTSTQGKLFFTGVFSAVAALIEPTAIVLLVLRLIIVLMKERKSYKEFFVTLFGFFIVYLYLFAYYFLTDQLPQFISIFNIEQFILSYRQIVNYGIGQAIVLGVFLLFILILILYFDNIKGSKNINIRYRITYINLLTFFCLIVAGGYYGQIYQALIIPLAAFFSMLNLQRNKQLWLQITFFTIIMLAILISRLWH